ncbi:MAG: tetratricopeptide repeat protein [Labilithrix sp.]|nr:tetratricopeptide repeat protein [Labilithrix sp.]
MESGAETHRLRQEIERALRRAFDPADVLPRLARLARIAPAASDDGIFAHRQLAELLVERHPWRAAIYARRALAHGPDDDRAWAVLAFCQTLLGNFRCAATAYRRAIACAPGNPWYAHNLGHLLDVALGTPARALPWLRSAYGAKGDNSEIVASYVHALARAGKTREARDVLERALDRFDSRELEALLRWLDQGAPSREGKRTSKALPDQEPRAFATAEEAEEEAARPVRAPKKDQRFTRVLERGLSHLPLDQRQRERALVLARDALAGKAPPPSRKRATPGRGDDVAGLAAAVAYAIVYIDHVPLSQAEVAAPFRVAVGRLRGRFAELRAKLDIIPGDARYATTRA